MQAGGDGKCRKLVLFLSLLSITGCSAPPADSELESCRAGWRSMPANTKRYDAKGEFLTKCVESQYVAICRDGEIDYANSSSDICKDRGVTLWFKSPDA